MKVNKKRKGKYGRQFCGMEERKMEEREREKMEVRERKWGERERRESSE